LDKDNPLRVIVMHKTETRFSRCGAIDECLEFFTSPATENILSTSTEDVLGVRKNLPKQLISGTLHNDVSNKKGLIISLPV